MPKWDNAMNIKNTYWILFAATIIIYAIMLFWSLPNILADSNGLLPFDLRPRGYSFSDAQQLLNALSSEGTAFYKNIQTGMLDMAFPALLLFTLATAFWLLAPASWGKWRYVLILAALPGTIFDYLENFSIINMLSLGANNITPQIVELASANSTYKSISITMSLSLLLILIVLWAWRKYNIRQLEK